MPRGKSQIERDLARLKAKQSHPAFARPITDFTPSEAERAHMYDADGKRNELWCDPFAWTKGATEDHNIYTEPTPNADGWQSFPAPPLRPFTPARGQPRIAKRKPGRKPKPKPKGPPRGPNKALMKRRYGYRVLNWAEKHRYILGLAGVQLITLSVGKYTTKNAYGQFDTMEPMPLKIYYPRAHNIRIALRYVAGRNEAVRQALKQLGVYVDGRIDEHNTIFEKY